MKLHISKFGYCSFVKSWFRSFKGSWLSTSVNRLENGGIAMLRYLYRVIELIDSISGNHNVLAYFPRRKAKKTSLCVGGRCLVYLGGDSGRGDWGLGANIKGGKPYNILILNEPLTASDYRFLSLSIQRQMQPVFIHWPLCPNGQMQPQEFNSFILLYYISWVPNNFLLMSHASESERLLRTMWKVGGSGRGEL